jgi:hypothetical protein
MHMLSLLPILLALGLIPVERVEALNMVLHLLLLLKFILSVCIRGVPLEEMLLLLLGVHHVACCRSSLHLLPLLLLLHLKLLLLEVLGVRKSRRVSRRPWGSRRASIEWHLIEVWVTLYLVRIVRVGHLELLWWRLSPRLEERLAS